MGQFSVSVRWWGLGDGFIWACSGIYDPNDNNLRGQMWDELNGIQQFWEVPWCYIGDFNIVRFPSERLGGLRLILAIENFSEFMLDRFSIGRRELHMVEWFGSAFDV